VVALHGPQQPARDHRAIAPSARLFLDYGGRLIKGTGDGVLATFDAPVRGLRCADKLRSSLADAGIAIRAGVHTGEVELRGDDVSGIGVHIAALAGSGEFLASRTVKDLVAGSDYAFTSRGVHSLKGVPEEWELLGVSSDLRAGRRPGLASDGVRTSATPGRSERHPTVSRRARKSSTAGARPGRAEATAFTRKRKLAKLRHGHAARRPRIGVSFFERADLLGQDAVALQLIGARTWRPRPDLVVR
jgi:hypothetical protein